MRAVIGLLAYLLVVSAIISVGIMGAMAFEMSFVEQVPFAPVTSGASHEKRTFIQGNGPSKQGAAEAAEDSALGNGKMGRNGLRP
jgi:hypothetical protein